MGYVCPKCRVNHTAAQWNQATARYFGLRTGGVPIDSPCVVSGIGFACPHCNQVADYQAIKDATHSCDAHDQRLIRLGKQALLDKRKQRRLAARRGRKATRSDHWREIYARFKPRTHPYPG